VRERRASGLLSVVTNAMHKKVLIMACPVPAKPHWRKSSRRLNAVHSTPTTCAPNSTRTSARAVDPDESIETISETELRKKLSAG
jgi:hypothetical protein